MTSNGSFPQMLPELSDGFWLQLVGSLSVALIIIAAFMAFVWHAIDSWRLPLNVAKALVLEKTHRPASFTAHEDIAGLLKMPITRFVEWPEVWSLRLQTQTGERLIDVSKSVYETAQVNGTVSVRYGLGRLSERQYLKAVAA